MFDVETKKLVYAMLYGKKTVARLGKCITRDNSRRLPPKFFFQNIEQTPSQCALKIFK